MCVVREDSVERKSRPALLPVTAFTALVLFQKKEDVVSLLKIDAGEGRMVKHRLEPRPGTARSLLLAAVAFALLFSPNVVVECKRSYFTVKNETSSLQIGCQGQSFKVSRDFSGFVLFCETRGNTDVSPQVSQPFGEHETITFVHLNKSCADKSGTWNWQSAAWESKNPSGTVSSWV